MSTALRHRLSPCIRLRFPEFEEQYRFEERTGLGGAKAYHFEEVDCHDWYRQFAERVVRAVDQRDYLPLYRMADGEYAFALQVAHEELVPFWELSWRGKLSLMWKYLRGRRGDHRAGFSGEHYSVQEREAAYQTFIDGVRHAAQNGILAAAFHRSSLLKHYFPEIFDWFDEHDVPLHAGNYIHMYATYALMHGKEANRLLADRHVLVVTRLNEQRMKNIRQGLHRQGADTVQFVPVSAHQAMLDDVELSAVERPVDLALIAAGVGTSNVLLQMKKLRIPQLDVGYCIDTLADPELRWNRPFCVPDGEFDPAKVEYVS